MKIQKSYSTLPLLIIMAVLLIQTGSSIGVPAATIEPSTTIELSTTTPEITPLTTETATTTPEITHGTTESSTTSEKTPATAELTTTTPETTTTTTKRALTAKDLSSLAVLDDTDAAIQATKLVLYRQKTQLSLNFLTEIITALQAIHNNLTKLHDVPLDVPFANYKQADDVLEDELTQVENKMGSNRLQIQKYSLAFQHAEEKLRDVHKTLGTILLPHLTAETDAGETEAESDLIETTPSSLSMPTGSAVIITPPQNMTKLEGEKVIFPCEWRAFPTNASVVWLRDGIPVRQISSLESRIETPPGTEGSLIVNPVSADDSGFYECRVTNGIGGTQTAIAYLNVECPAQVTYTPTVQYLPHRLAGVVRCYIMANPPIQFVMWTKDKHLLEPYEEEGFSDMNNGSLLIDPVKETHQGQYTCTPYNVHGTKGSSLQMQVIVKEPPKFEVTPEPMYQSKLGASLEIPCSAIAPNGTNSPLITWRRKDGKSLPRDRVRVVEGSLMIENVHETDFGEYECVASNEVATLVFTTKIYVEGAPPQAPYNVTGIPPVFGVSVSVSV